MAVNLKRRDFLTLHDFSRDEIVHILRTAENLKDKWRIGEPHSLLAGKILAMIFQKPSLRTRVSFEAGIIQLGGHGIYLGPEDIGLGARESIEDIAMVLSRYVDGIMVRVFGHEIVEDLARYATVPVINGLSDFAHPCQVLGDLLTIYEKKGELSDLRLAYIGDGNNVAHSLIYGCAKFGIHITLANPRGYEPRERVVREAMADAQESGAVIRLTSSPEEAVAGADVIYTDVWASMGQESEAEERKKDFRVFQVNRKLLEGASGDFIVMHCLPAHYGEEITREISKGPHSVIYDQAENRLHAQKALLVELIG